MIVLRLICPKSFENQTKQTHSECPQALLLNSHLSSKLQSDPSLTDSYSYSFETHLKIHPF